MPRKLLIHNPHLDGDTFFWPGGPIGVLLTHGYTATTAEVRLLARQLHQQGYTVAGPLLPGHGVTPEAMNRCRWQEWAEAVAEAYAELTTHCQYVFVGGESMGALLALYLASEQPEVAGILAYAPALRISRFTCLKARLAAPFISAMPKARIAEDKPWQGYTVNPIPAFLQLLSGQKEVRRRLPHIRQPLLVIQGCLDRLIDPRGAEILYHEIGSPIKELHWMENSSHVVILDGELEQVTELTLRFIEKVMNQIEAGNKGGRLFPPDAIRHNRAT